MRFELAIHYVTLHYKYIFCYIRELFSLERCFSKEELRKVHFYDIWLSIFLLNIHHIMIY